MAIGHVTIIIYVHRTGRIDNLTVTFTCSSLEKTKFAPHPTEMISKSE